MGWLPYFSCWNMSSVVISNSVWNSKCFVRLWMVVLAEVMWSGKTNASQSKIFTPIRAKHCLFFKWWKWSNVVNLPLVTDWFPWWMMYEGFIVDQVLADSHSAIALAKSTLVQNHLMSPCITSNPAYIANLFISPLIKNRGDWRKRLIDIYKANHLVHLIIKIHLCLFGEHSHGTNTFTICTYLERFYHDYNCPCQEMPAYNLKPCVNLSWSFSFSDHKTPHEAIGVSMDRGQVAGVESGNIKFWKHTFLFSSFRKYLDVIN